MQRTARISRIRRLRQPARFFSQLRERLAGHLSSRTPPLQNARRSSQPVEIIAFSTQHPPSTPTSNSKTYAQTSHPTLLRHLTLSLLRSMRQRWAFRSQPARWVIASLRPYLGIALCAIELFPSAVRLSILQPFEIRDKGSIILPRNPLQFGFFGLFWVYPKKTCLDLPAAAALVRGVFGPSKAPARQKRQKPAVEFSRPARYDAVLTEI
jgi:hypothetical protein